jgi:hypothetical protein
MHFDHNERTIFILAIVGVFGAAGKLLLGGKKVTVRLALGRVLIGACLSMAAGAALLEFPQLSPEGLVGIGSALGILGLEFLEQLAQRWLGWRVNSAEKDGS